MRFVEKVMFLEFENRFFQTKLPFEPAHLFVKKIHSFWNFAKLGSKSRFNKNHTFQEVEEI